MNCPKCGKANYGDNQTCFNCGTPLFPQPTLQSPPPMQRQPMPPPHQPPGKTPQQMQQQPPSSPMPMPMNPPQPTIRQTMQPPLQQPRPIVTPPGPPPIPPSGPGAIPPRPRIYKPTTGVCSICDRRALEFYDDGMGRCVYCGRTFNWIEAQMRRFQEGGGVEEPEEENPFMVSEDDKLPDSERKAEVEPEEVIYHEIGETRVSSSGRNKKKKDKDDLTDEKRLQMLEDRFLNGEISEEIYNKLRKKYVTRYMRSLEDKLVDGEISEDEYKEKKDEVD